VNRPGAWAEFVAIPQSNCWHADPSIPLDVLSCFDPLGNAVHTALSFDLVGEDVLITGAGPIGCMAVPICKQAGARHVVLTDINPYRLDLARKMAPNIFGVDVRTEKLADAMEKLGMKEGFDVALEMSGNPKAFADILPNMFHGGKQSGACHGVITDINPYRLELSRKMGVNLALDVRTKTLADAMKTLGMKEGFDIALEMSGSPKALADILPNMFHGGKIALLGIMPGSAAIDWNLVVFNQLTIKGIYGREMYETWYKMTALIQSGLDISPVITHRFPYKEFREAIELMKSGNSGKIVLDWSQLSS